MPARRLFKGAAKQHHRIRRRHARFGRKREFVLARTKFDLERTQRQTGGRDIMPQNIHDGRDLIVTPFGQILKAMRRVAHRGRLGRPGERLGRKPKVFDLEEVKLDLEPGHIVKAGVCEFRQCIAISLAGCEGNFLAIREIAVAQQPTGAVGPRQHAECLRIGHHDEIAGAAHFRQAQAAACLENREHRAMRRVLGKQRARHGDAVMQRP